MNKTSIEWCDFTANPLKFRAPDGRVVWACEKLSAGCTNCYAAHLSTRYGGVRRAGDWNAATMATLTPFLDEAELRKMLRFKAVVREECSWCLGSGSDPTGADHLTCDGGCRGKGWKERGARVFVGDMTDIFGAWVPDALLDQLFAVFALRPDVTWQVLTKRAERLRDYVNDRYRLLEVTRHIHARLGDQAARALSPIPWPLSNVWFGVSVEDQTRADERIPLLLQASAVVRFISAEPLLGDVNLAAWMPHDAIYIPAEPSPSGKTQCRCIRCGRLTAGMEKQCRTFGMQTTGIDWLIVGGESGPGARHCCLSWIRNIVHDCAEAKVPCFVKQYGARPYETTEDDGADGECRWPVGREVKLRDAKGGDVEEWESYLRVREFPKESVTA